jgi:hypothetical protein
MNNIIYNCETFGLFVYENKETIGSYPIKNFKEMAPMYLHYDNQVLLKTEAKYWSLKTNSKVDLIEKGNPFILIERTGKIDLENMITFEKWLISYNEDKFGWIGMNFWLSKYIDNYKK